MSTFMKKINSSIGVSVNKEGEFKILVDKFLDAKKENPSHTKLKIIETGFQIVIAGLILGAVLIWCVFAYSW